MIADSDAESSPRLASQGKLSKFSYAHTYIHTYIHTLYINTSIHTYIHITIKLFKSNLYIHTYIHIYLQTCTHTPMDDLDKVESLIELLVESNQVPPEKQVCSFLPQHCIS